VAGARIDLNARAGTLRAEGRAVAVSAEECLAEADVLNLDLDALSVQAVGRARARRGGWIAAAGWLELARPGEPTRRLADRLGPLPEQRPEEAPLPPFAVGPTGFAWSSHPVPPQEFNALYAGDFR
jgi:hypothetical protein